MDQHIKILGIASIAYHVVQALLVAVVIPILISMGVVADQPEIRVVLGSIAVVIVVVVLLLTLPGIIGGFGLLRYKRWARILLFISNSLSLFSFPFGTALGAYTFWVLTKDEALDMLDG